MCMVEEGTNRPTRQNKKLAINSKLGDCCCYKNTLVRFFIRQFSIGRVRRNMNLNQSFRVKLQTNAKWLLFTSRLRIMDTTCLISLIDRLRISISCLCFGPAQFSLQPNHKILISDLGPEWFLGRTHGQAAAASSRARRNLQFANISLKILSSWTQPNDRLLDIKNGKDPTSIENRLE